MARNTEEKREKLREALVGIAETRIADAGYAALTARDLAREAGCAVGAIYTAFADMDDLVARVNSRTIARLEAAVAEAYAREGSAADPKRSLVLLGQTYFSFVQTNPRLWSAIFELGLGSTKELPQWRVDEHVRLIGHIVKPLHGLLPQMDESRRVVLAKALFSAVHGIVSLGMQRRFVSVPPDEIADQIRFIVEGFCDGVAAAA